jgi:hypothetical protein
MKLQLTAKEINLKEVNGMFSYRINGNILVEGIPSKLLALESASENYVLVFDYGAECIVLFQAIVLLFILNGVKMIRIISSNNTTL